VVDHKSSCNSAASSNCIHAMVDAMKYSAAQFVYCNVPDECKESNERFSDTTYWSARHRLSLIGWQKTIIVGMCQGSDSTCVGGLASPRDLIGIVLRIHTSIWRIKTLSSLRQRLPGTCKIHCRFSYVNRPLPSSAVLGLEASPMLWKLHQDQRCIIGISHTSPSLRVCHLVYRNQDDGQWGSN